jgi:hypothetical protein
LEPEADGSCRYPLFCGGGGGENAPDPPGKPARGFFRGLTFP